MRARLQDDGNRHHCENNAEDILKNDDGGNGRAHGRGNRDKEISKNDDEAERTEPATSVNRLSGAEGQKAQMIGRGSENAAQNLKDDAARAMA